MTCLTCNRSGLYPYTFWFPGARAFCPGMCQDVDGGLDGAQFSEEFVGVQPKIVLKTSPGFLTFLEDGYDEKKSSLQSFIL
jgi:hypothetical protein